MTLAKAVEAARETMRQTVEYLRGLPRDNAHSMYAKNFAVENEKSIASLPEPMTESEIADVIITCGAKFFYREEAIKIIRALREAGCLYVREEIIMTKEKVWEAIKENFLLFMAAEEFFFGTVLIAMLILILDQLVRIKLTIK